MRAFGCPACAGDDAAAAWEAIRGRRDSLAEDLLATQATERLGFVRGVGTATPEAPHRNLMNAPWWTDGLRLVIELADEKVPIPHVRFFAWDWADEDVDGFDEMLLELEAPRPGEPARPAAPPE